MVELRVWFQQGKTNPNLDIKPAISQLWKAELPNI